MNECDPQQPTGSVCLEEKVQMKRLHQPQDVVLKQTAASPADVQLLSVQQDAELLHIKEEQEELWTSQREEQLNGQERTDITRFSFTAAPVKSDEEQKRQSSQHHRSQTEDYRESEPSTSSSVKQTKAETDGEDCRGPEPAQNPDPDTHSQPSTEEKPVDSFETGVSDEDGVEEEEEDDEDWQEPFSDFGPETDDSDNDWKETRTPESGVNSECDTEKNLLPALTVVNSFSTNVLFGDTFSSLPAAHLIISVLK
ncbi:cyclin-dependent kinase 11B-like [Acanthochromis polyacanthus]|uniref:cyclin-dependent kinase 11B-like n=1 Tax=Acanthochromis polyacanthus TaxID=80966 RepID=UPI00223405B9|nr:cyclin-dependent kinase 11B-like [Acanthochromis polyacanthus]